MLPMIQAVGFRTKSPEAVEFHRWADEILQSYLRDSPMQKFLPLSKVPLFPEGIKPPAFESRFCVEFCCGVSA